MENFLRRFRSTSADYGSPDGGNVAGGRVKITRRRKRSAGATDVSVVERVQFGPARRRRNGT